MKLRKYSTWNKLKAHFKRINERSWTRRLSLATVAHCDRPPLSPHSPLSFVAPATLWYCVHKQRDITDHWAFNAFLMSAYYTPHISCWVASCLLHSPPRFTFRTTIKIIPKTKTDTRARTQKAKTEIKYKFAYKNNYIWKENKNRGKTKNNKKWKYEKLKNRKSWNEREKKSAAQHGQQAENLCVLLFQHAKWVKQKPRKKSYKSQKKKKENSFSNWKNLLMYNLHNSAPDKLLCTARV